MPAAGKDTDNHALNCVSNSTKDYSVTSHLTPLFEEHPKERLLCPSPVQGCPSLDYELPEDERWEAEAHPHRGTINIGGTNGPF